MKLTLHVVVLDEDEHKLVLEALKTMGEQARIVLASYPWGSRAGSSLSVAAHDCERLVARLTNRA